MINQIIEIYNSDKFIFFVLLIAILVLLIVICVLIYSGLDRWLSIPESRSATIKDKKYKPETTHTGTGYGFGANGQATVMVTSSTDDEDFLLIVVDDKEIFHTIEVSPTFYYNKEVGDRIDIDVFIGRFSKDICSAKIKEV